MTFSFFLYTSESSDSKKITFKYIFPEITKKFNYTKNNVKKNICEFIFNALQSPITENIFVTAHIMQKKYYMILSNKQCTILPLIENFLDIIIPETDNETVEINIIESHPIRPKPTFPKPKL